MVPLAAAAVTAPVPDGHVVVTFGTAAITTPAGRLSVKVRLVRAGLAAGLVMVKVSLDVRPSPTGRGSDVLVRAGNICTVRQLAVTLLVTRAIAPTLPALLVW